jgi:predicted ATP-dependent endonuclease of OLD family
MDDLFGINIDVKTTLKKEIIDVPESIKEPVREENINKIVEIKQKNFLTIDDTKVYVKENKNRVYLLDNSASGYFEALYILSNILGKRDSVIILDEPALHLHPIKIKQLANELKRLVEASGNQVILITHSPYFVTYELLEDKSTNLLYIRKDDNGSKVYHKPKDFKLDLKPHLFNPNIFFTNCVILVEGSSDEAVLSAINNNLRNILDNHDIAIIHFGGKDNIDKYIELCNKYDIKYVAMIDDDYLFRWNKIHEDKERLLREMKDDKMKDKLKKEGIKLNGFSIDDKDDIKIMKNDSEISIKNKQNKEIKFQLRNNNQECYLIVDDKEIKLAVECIRDCGDYYIYRDDKKKLNDKRENDNIIILEGELEDELRRLWIDNIKESWDKNNNKIKELEAYEFIDALMKDDKEKIKNSKFYQVFEKAFDKIQKSKILEEAWNNK